MLYISGANAGMHLMLTAKNNLSESELVARAAKGSVRVYGLSEYYSFGECSQKKGSVIVGYSGMSNEELSAGIQALEKAWL
jgi:GntR family transcriptional regulator/MocR family aminotransferase